MRTCREAILLACLVPAAIAQASTHYVVPTNLAASYPFTTWATAATNIQDAISACASYDTVVVSNGVYATGGLAFDGTLTSRIVLTNAVVVQSANGPDVTIIRGQGPVGPSAVRCAYVGNGSMLVGFTLTNGATRPGTGPVKERAGGGAFCMSGGVVSNCLLVGNSATYGGGAYGGSIFNCVLSRNTAAYSGGGADGGTLNGCILTGNSATNGGGASSATLNDCVLSGNVAMSGGGSRFGTLNHCRLTGNSALSGGGGYVGTLNQCTIISNSAADGGGVYDGLLYNCILGWNTAATNGGGSLAGTLENCTIVGNSATNRGGGVFLGLLNNCIIYFNTASNGPNWAAPDFVFYSCTTPDQGFDGNVTNDPQFVDLAGGDLRLMPGSPCIDAGSNQAWMVGATDIAGNPRVWNGRADIGAYELSLTPFHYVVSTNPAASYPFATWATAATNIQDAIDACASNDTVLVSNGVYATGGVAVHGAMINRVALTNAVAVRSVNGPDVTVIMGAGQGGGVRCAYVGTNATLSGFALSSGGTRTSGDTALEQSGGGVWCEDSGTVSNCVLSGNYAFYDGGGAYNGLLYNCSLASNSAIAGGGAAFGTLYGCTVTSNHATFGGGVRGGTLYDCALTGNEAYDRGGGAGEATMYRCFVTGNRASGLGSGEGGGVCRGTLYDCSLNGNLASTAGGGACQAALFGCTVSSNWASDYGGGVLGGTLSNCTVKANQVSNFDGGGAADATLYNCVLAGNVAQYGAGASALPWTTSALYNCTVVGNDGGGVYASIISNSVVYFNTEGAARIHSNHDNGSIFGYSCTVPLPAGDGNITNLPDFVDENAGDYRLQDASPCIDAGTNSYWMVGSVDLAGSQRILRGHVDMGAYEFTGVPRDTDNDGLPDGREAVMGTATNNPDTDSDRMRDGDEVRAQTDPLSILSQLNISNADTSPSSTNSFSVRWSSVAGLRYRLKRSTDLMPGAFYDVKTNIPAVSAETEATDTNAPAIGPCFYRVTLEE